MFSSLTYEGARVTLDALEAGAVDFLPKNFEEIARDTSQLQKILIQRILDVAGSRPGARSAPAAPRPATPAPEPRREPAERPGSRLTRPATPEPRKEPAASEPVRRPARKTATRHYKLVAIGTSTGGPVALQKVLTSLPASFPAPIVLIQHMPAAFTNAFAERLNKLCKIEVREARDGDMLRAGLALLAPGGKQMMIDNRGQVRVLDGDERLNYKPSVDVTFGSAAKVFNDKVLAVVLTGMGADGREGARMLKSAGSQVWAQDEASCVIYGMPMAVVKAGLDRKS